MRALAEDPAYRELDVDTVARFAAPYLGSAPLRAEEVGDGNLNRVFRVHGESSSVIVKQALPYLKVAGASWPLTRHRARIERDALEAHGKVAPDLVPHVIHFDPSLSALVCEDLQGYTSWRNLLVAGADTPGVAERVGRYTGTVLLGTSDVTMPSRERKELRKHFGYTELCLVTEELVFTAPYVAAPSNRYDEELSDLVSALQADKSVQQSAAQLRFAFKTRDEALIHGDLHTGSVLVGADDAKVIDLEFAFFGPFGFDPGLLLANLALAQIAHEAGGDDQTGHRIGGYAATFWAAFDEQCRRLWAPTEPWYHRFRASVLADAARFAGLEMIRRIVGLAHAADIDSLSQPTRQAAQRRVLAGGRALITGSNCTSFEELWQRATQEEPFA